MHDFLNTLSHFTPLSDESTQALAAISRRLELPKGHQLVQAHTVCRYFYFIESGLTRTYYLKNDKDVTDWISAEGSFAVSIISYITQQPDRRMIELLEPSVLWAVHHDDLERLCARHHDIEHLIRQLVSFGLVQVQQKFDDLHFATARQRYQTLVATHPTYIQRVPQHMIASYLGVTQETLSRIRAQL